MADAKTFGAAVSRQSTSDSSGCRGAASTLVSQDKAQAKSRKPLVRPARGFFDVTFVGTGVSTGIPVLSHVLRGGCSVCSDAHRNPGSRNRRNNVSILLRHSDEKTGAERNILVDVGKTMRPALMNTCPAVGVHTIDAIFLTHGHADAILGLDDVRDLQDIEEVYDGDKMIGYRPIRGGLQVISNEKTIKTTKKCFPYLAKRPECVPGRPGVALRRTASIDWKVVSDDATLNMWGLRTQLFPVFHGGRYVSLAFEFGRKGEFVYISDVSSLPEKSMSRLRSIKPAIQTLVVDCLQVTSHTTHFGFDEMLDFVRTLAPKVTYITGISCWLGEHHAVQSKLDQVHRAEGLDIRVAWDGLVLPPMRSAL